MVFDKFWIKVCESIELPNTARSQIPTVLSEETKIKLMRLKPMDAGNIINSAIEEINHGSIEVLDKLVLRRMH